MRDDVEMIVIPEIVVGFPKMKRWVEIKSSSEIVEVVEVVEMWRWSRCGDGRDAKNPKIPRNSKPVKDDTKITREHDE